MTVQSIFEVPLEYPNMHLKSCEVLHLAVCHPSLSYLERPYLEAGMPQGGMGKEGGLTVSSLTSAIDLLDV